MRKNILAGNWKMNTSPAEGLILAQEISDLSSSTPSNVELIVAPPFTHIIPMVQILKESKVKVSSQNCAQWESGAYTGEVSASMIASTAATHVILGHSERREYFNENSQSLLAKVKQALDNKLTVIFCCGEKLDERDANKHFEVVQAQIKEVLFNLTPEQMESIIVAYEPVWAIGTGRTASPEQAQEMHHNIRGFVAEHFGEKISQDLSILYGGSCKPSNAQEIFANPDVDGGLIGGASLKAADFIAIAKSFPQ
ncbi:MAG: triose-phosphate isomerase [Bacteroidales bacterium]